MILNIFRETMKVERKTMTDEEKTLLLQIDTLYNELLRENDGYNYCWKAKVVCRFNEQHLHII